MAAGGLAANVLLLAGTSGLQKLLHSDTIRVD
jgi:hypothetical protein